MPRRHPLGFESLLTIDSHSDHLDTVAHLRKTGRPAIVIAASGMCAGGLKQNYLKALLPDKRTDDLFVGYVMLEGEKVQINAQAHTLSGYSAHADQKDLVNFVGRMRSKHMRIVHGDDDAKEALQKLYQQMLPECDVVIGC